MTSLIKEAITIAGGILGKDATPCSPSERADLLSMEFPVAMNVMVQTMASLAIVEPLRELDGCIGGFEVALLKEGELEGRHTIDSSGNHMLEHPSSVHRPRLCEELHIAVCGLLAGKHVHQ